MKLKTLFILTTVVFGLFGIGLTLAPAPLMALLYDAQTDAIGVYGVRSWAAASFGQALLAWLVRNMAPSKTKQAIVTAFFVTYTINFVIDLTFQLSGQFNAFGWSSPIIAGFFALGYGYFAVLKPESGQPS